VRRRLRVKVIALIVAILVVGFGILVTVNIQREAQVLVDAHQETARLLAASILGSIESGMLEARPDVIRRLVGDLKGELKEVRRLDVYRANGVEAFADLDTLTKVDRGPGSVIPCSRAPSRPTPPRRATSPSTAAAC
jgi:hypothetical protein